MPRRAPISPVPPTGQRSVFQLPPARQGPQDARGIEVSQRLFVAAARMAVSSQYVSGSMLQRRLRTDAEATQRLLLALEGTGVIGPLRDGEHVVLVPPGQLAEVFARFGILEDTVPPGFE